MAEGDGFRRIAGWAAIVSTAANVGAFVAAIAAAGSFDNIANPALTLPALAGRGLTFWWSWVLTALSFLLWLPLVVVLWTWLRPKSTNFFRLSAQCGFAGLVVGAIGQIVPGAVALQYAKGYSAATEALRQLYSEVYGALFHAFDFGVTRVLFAFLIGVWLMGVYPALVKERRGLGWATAILGIVSLIVALATALGMEAVSSGVVFLYIVLAPIWGLWMGIDLVRSPAAGRS